MTEPDQETRPPRGALIVIAVGLLACLAAALLATDKASGEAAQLEWVKRAPIPDSRPAAVPGGGTMQLTEGAIRTTGINVSGYYLFRISSRLRISAGAPIGGGRILCAVKAGGGAEIAQSGGGLRATYPRSTTGLLGQPVSETILLDFSSHGTELAVLELDGMPPEFATEAGVKLEWPKFVRGTEHLEYFLPDGKPKQDLVLPFETVWKATRPAAARISCTLTTSGGETTVRTAVALHEIPPPIDEEQEAENQERAEEAEEEAQVE